MNGFINIDKSENMSSAAVVAKVKRLFGVKCGHMGTLDPLATGVLPVALGNATRLFDYILQKEKIYITKIVFGKSTDTLDRSGETIGETDIIPDLDKVFEAAQKLTGEILQVPPKISAKHVNGSRSYLLARKGVSFELEPKKVTVHYIKFLNRIDEKTYSFEISCSGGTYIRSIARDLGSLCGSLAYMSELRRIKSGIFEISNTVTLDKLLNSESPESFIIPSDTAVSFDKLFLEDEPLNKTLNGVAVKTDKKDGLYRVYGGGFLGIGKVNEGMLKMRAYVR